MIWSKFSIKIFGVHFGNSVSDNSNWGKISHILTKKKSATLFGMKIYIYIGQIYTIPKFTKEEIAKAIAQLSI